MMRRQSNHIDDYSLNEFQELLTDLRFTSLKTANLSTNVAVAFLTGIPHVARRPNDVHLSRLPTYNESFVPGTPHESYPLDQDRIIEFEEERIDRQYTADGEEARSFRRSNSDGRNAEDGMGISKARMRLMRWQSHIANMWRRYRDRRSDILEVADNHHMGLENRETQRRKKFYISYAELIIPSQDTYNPNFMNIPLHYGIVKAKSCGNSSPGNSDAFDAPDTTAAELSDFAEINARFRAANEWLHPSLSLTKLSRIKLTMFLAPRSVTHLDPSTVFSAWILFERLVIKGVVTKQNRKLYAATCLIIAYKFNQDGEHVVVNEIIAYLCRDRAITPSAIFASEMKVFTLLEFSLKQSYNGMRRHVQHYLEFNRITFMDLYETSESTVARVQPWVLQHGGSVRPLARILFKAHVTELDELAACLVEAATAILLHQNAVPRVGLNALQHLVDGLLGRRPERWPSEEQLESKYPQRPDVAFVVVFAEFPLDIVLACTLLRGPVVVGAPYVADCAAAAAHMCRQTEVSQLAAEVVVQQDIFRLYVQVRDVLVVAGPNGPCDLEKDLSHALLWKPPMQIQMRIEVSMEAVLEHNVDHRLRVEPGEDAAICSCGNL
ncbi:cyclin dependent kinase binding protein [Babesia ovata]|uniref:Cyclin dependent kinase binding protein n=1 Tax=Babesia ovata TaxID=189622 RepID=A0A2H6KCX7_9APIC|nr:cyclin dependent kinase binding protein [Babesia ovata]GBE60850.1 cyclin dependent kinase binding protein [Babesia ovata]